MTEESNMTGSLVPPSPTLREVLVLNMASEWCELWPWLKKAMPDPLHLDSRRVVHSLISGSGPSMASPVTTTQSIASRSTSRSRGTAAVSTKTARQ